MNDYYDKVLGTRIGRSVLGSLGFPTPVELRRPDGERGVFLSGSVLLGASEDAALQDYLVRCLAASEARVCIPAGCGHAARILAAAGREKLDIDPVECSQEALSERFSALVLDATGIETAAQLNQLHGFFHPVMRNLDHCARVVIVGRRPEDAPDAEAAAARAALEGFCRSIAKEIGKRGATANLVRVEDGAGGMLDGPLRFLLSPRAAYVDGQVLTVTGAPEPPDFDPAQPLAGRTALVTGASRGIGEAIARTLARDGARVIGLDIEAAADDLDAVMADIGGKPVVADITHEKAPRYISQKLADAGGGDIIVHNAGITRDKTLANMPEAWWEQTLDINLGAVLRINERLLADDVIAEHGRIIGVSSMNGIAGQVGQSNYAASKAGVIGWVRHLAADLRDSRITVNAVAPGFIETQMTAAIPMVTREIGRRMNSLSQGGVPGDVAEAIAFFAEPGSAGVTGNVLRVCGQCVVGA